jgi:hypothetical protein
MGGGGGGGGFKTAFLPSGLWGSGPHQPQPGGAALGETEAEVEEWGGGRVRIAEPAPKREKQRLSMPPSQAREGGGAARGARGGPAAPRQQANGVRIAEPESKRERETSPANASPSSARGSAARRGGRGGARRRKAVAGAALVLRDGRGRLRAPLAVPHHGAWRHRGRRAAPRKANGERERERGFGSLEYVGSSRRMGFGWRGPRRIDPACLDACFSSLSGFSPARLDSCRPP